MTASVVVGLKGVFVVVLVSLCVTDAVSVVECEALEVLLPGSVSCSDPSSSSFSFHSSCNVWTSFSTETSM